MEPHFIIDASEAYSDGQQLYVVPDGTYGMFLIKFKSKGSVPKEIGGCYSSAFHAKLAAEQYINAMATELEIKKRRKAVKVGKEEWAAKKAKEVEKEV